MNEEDTDFSSYETQSLQGKIEMQNVQSLYMYTLPIYRIYMSYNLNIKFKYIIYIA